MAQCAELLDPLYLLMRKELLRPEDPREDRRNPAPAKRPRKREPRRQQRGRVHQPTSEEVNERIGSAPHRSRPAQTMG